MFKKNKIKFYKITKLFPLILAFSPLFLCLGLPLAWLYGDFQQAGKCTVCRLLAAVSKNENNRFC